MAVRIAVENEKIVRRTPLVLVSNNEYRMSGLQAGTRESLARGHLALYVVNAEGRPGLLRLAWEVFLKGAEQAKEIDLVLVEEATIETRRRHLQVATDGEVFTLESPLEYRIRPAALRVYVLPEVSACYPHPPQTSSNRS